MTAPAGPGPDLAARARLFAPGERLGWVFRDRRQFFRPFTEPPPLPEPVPPHLVAAEQAAARRHRERVASTGKIGGWTVGVSLGLGLLTGAAGSAGAAVTFLVCAVIAAAGCGAVIAMSKRAWAAKASALAEAQRRLAEAHARRTAEWQRRRDAYWLQEKARVDQLAEWGAAQTPPGTRRLEVFGGNLWAWQAFLTVYGTSALTRRPVIVVDLSREVVCDELVLLADAAGVPVDAQMLPDQLARTTLLTGLPTRQIADALIESMYGEDPTASRSERAMDDRILTTLCDTLGENLSLGRIAAGLRALLDQPDPSEHLTAREREHIADELFSTDYRQHAAERLHRLESYIQPLEVLGTGSVENDPGYLTCIALASAGHNVRADLLTDLIVQWLTHRIAAQVTHTPEVIVVGADTIALRNLERLSDTCERRNVRLTLLFRHLRDQAAQFMGGGVTGFMRMGNAAEATQAADHIGREHKFVISQITKTLGGNETHTDTDTYGESDTEGVSVSESVGWAKNWSRGKSTTRRGGQIFGDPPDRGTSSSTGGSYSETHTETRNWSKTRNWSTSRAFAEGTNWSDATSLQRVHEHAVDPTELQHLPDHALLLIKVRPGQRPDLVPVEFDPAIITLPRVSTEPLPALSRPPAPPAPAPLPPAHTPAVSYQYHPAQATYTTETAPAPHAAPPPVWPPPQPPWPPPPPR